jgi:hypothetical protein
MNECAILASILIGEAGGMSTFGLQTVASTIATRLEHGQTLERIFKEYYARSDKENLEATGIAAALLAGIYPASGAEFCLSDDDVVKLRAKGMKIEVAWRVEHIPTGQGLNLVKEWK